MSDCANERFYVWLIEKFSWFEIHMAGYVKETYFADRLILYKSLKAKNSVLYLLLEKNAKKGLFWAIF